MPKLRLPSIFMDTSQVHRLSQDPDEAWNSMANTQIVRRVKPMPLDTPINPKSVRFVCLSDTHSMTENLCVPPGDVLLHAGDFTMHGSDKEIKSFNSFLKKLPHKHKIVIAGNHDANMDRRYNCTLEDQLKALSLTSSAKLIKDAIYLQDSAVIVSGIKIYGTPWQPVHLPGAFTINRGAKCLAKWSAIPNDTDILLSHTPPLGHGDLTKNGEHAGCVDLLTTVQKRVKPTYHVFGHIHEGYGLSSDGVTTFINSSICTTAYRPTNAPIIFDYPLPKSHI